MGWGWGIPRGSRPVSTASGPHGTAACAPHCGHPQRGGSPAAAGQPEGRSPEPPLEIGGSNGKEALQKGEGEVRHAACITPTTPYHPPPLLPPLPPLPPITTPTTLGRDTRHFCAYHLPTQELSSGLKRVGTRIYPGRNVLPLQYTVMG